jgi:hypothetical protein
MKTEVYVCDRCGDSIKNWDNHKHHAVYLGSQPCSVEGSEHLYREFDLCDDCAQFLLGGLLQPKRNDSSSAKAWLRSAGIPEEEEK